MTPRLIGMLGGAMVTVALLFAFTRASACKSTVHYIKTVDGRCLRTTGDGFWYRYYQREVSITECERRAR